MNDDERISVGTQLRSAIKNALDNEVERLGGRLGIKQAIIEAALFNFFCEPEESRRSLVERVLASNTDGGARELVQHAEVKARDAHHRSARGKDKRGPK